jgi:hypothetical protein
MLECPLKIRIYSLAETINCQYGCIDSRGEKIDPVLAIGHSEAY